MTAAKKSAAAAARTVAAQVAAYFAALDPATRKRLTELRAAIRAAAPMATDSFGYGIPGYRLDDRVLVFYAGFKEHVSIYPIAREFEEANAKALAGYVTSGRGTLRFSLEKAIPKGLVAKVVRFRAASVKAAAARRRPASKTRTRR